MPARSAYESSNLATRCRTTTSSNSGINNGTPSPSLMVQGKTWIINTFDYRGYQGNQIGAPLSFNFFNLYATTDRQSDGYDVIALQDKCRHDRGPLGSNCEHGRWWRLPTDVLRKQL